MIEIYTVSDCDCRIKVYDGDSQAEVEHCNVHRWAKELLKNAEALLDRLDNITTDDFSKGGEKQARERLQATVKKMRGRAPGW